MSYLRRPSVLALVFIIVLTFATQYYALRPETLDIDEATFMIVAQSALRGSLVYEHAFDNKPAGFFYLLAGVMGLFGQNSAVVRLFGDLSIALAAAAMLSLARRYVSLGIATGIVALFVVAQAGDLANSTKSEVVANAFVALSLVAYIRWPQSNWASFGAGLLIGCAVLVRTNLAYLALALALMHVIAAFRPDRFGLKRSSIFALAIGGLLLLGTLMIPYALQGQLQLLWVGLVEVPLSQAVGGRDLLGRIIMVPHLLVRLLPGFSATFVIVAAIGIFRLHRVLAVRPELRRDAMLGWVYAAAIAVSIAQSGAFEDHYILQLFPPMLLLAAIGFSETKWSARSWPLWIMRIGIVAGVAWFVPASMGLVWDQVRGSVDRHQLEAANAIRTELAPDDLIWAVGREHIALLYLNRDPVLPVVAFPGNIVNGPIVTPLIRAGLMPENAPHAIIQMRPRFIVASRPGAPSPLSGDDKAVFDQSYDLWHSGGGTYVYRLRDSQ
jgi:hypothetical protein